MILRHLSIDCVIFGFKDNKLCVLLWQSESDVAKRFFSEKDNYEEVEDLFTKNPIHSGQDYWALIGSHLPEDEDIDGYAKFILSKTTGLEDVYLNQVKTFGKVNRVPFSRVLTTAYYAIINPEYHDLRQSEMAKVLNWFRIDKLPKLVFDHKVIIEEALKKLRSEVKYHPVGFQMLPDKFTLTELQTLYEVILDTTLDTRNFRKKIQNMGLLIDTGEKQTNVAHRAAKLYSFDLDVYNKLKEEGLNFRI
ncbi:8-oxo-dGTP diphosphatase [Draconibacterium orientale]|jgi:8-oxo-dGTP diphosphatase|uniref:8-oxo-dGTP diphosphatase n=1 Tax=Draconibacterium orientale TaxID=1168034 RepID=X5DCY1_9BACT|nr:NUDIX hydrolase [Draconibacterium orientale]AHW60708.1 NUDIX hydrolase [Draconibacterium orientale]SEU01468.1 8-oxo-dGTP diphosphatase [Draconibacterium orientale]